MCIVVGSTHAGEKWVRPAQYKRRNMKVLRIFTLWAVALLSFCLAVYIGAQGNALKPAVATFFGGITVSAVLAMFVYAVMWSEE